MLQELKQNLEFSILDYFLNLIEEVVGTGSSL